MARRAVAVITADLDRFVAFYGELFEVAVVARSVCFEDPDGMGCEVLLMEVDLATILDQVQTSST